LAIASILRSGFPITERFFFVIKACSRNLP
jgi:hypothetical protein